MEACTNPRAGGYSGSLLARRGQAQGFDSPAHIAGPAQHTGDPAQRTAHYRVQIHDGEGGTGAFRNLYKYSLFATTFDVRTDLPSPGCPST